MTSPPIGTDQELIERAHGIAFGLEQDCRTDAADVIVELSDALQSRISEVERLTAALTPSADTKAAYIGEFKFQIELLHPRLGSEWRSVDVPWTTIKEIMAAILSRAALPQHRTTG